VSEPDPAAGAGQRASRKLLLGLIGAGIQRSLSPALHEEEGRRHGLRVHYQLIDVEPDAAALAALPALIAAARTMGFGGLNITHPCKQAVVPLLDELSTDAAAMGAVNTVLWRDGRAIGHNTDGSGWAWGFTHTLPQADLSRVVLLGAGGAGSAIAHAVLGLGAEQLLIVDADRARAQRLADALAARRGDHRTRASDDAAAALSGASGVIHATPTGMAKSPGMPLPPHLLRPSMWLSEVVYLPLETALLAQARRIGCAVCDGGTMAVGQAIGAFRLFTGLEPDAERMRRHFLELVAAPR
jgi:shikimate dehydrogenase